jgi:uncharacterized membrane protein YkoI
MSRRMRIIVAAAVVVVLALVLAGIKIAKHDESVSGPGADRARQAALEFVDGGAVKSVEFEKKGNAPWEVEVERPDGEEVELLLDADYNVLVVEEER